MGQGQEKLMLAIVTKLRADTGSGSLVELTGHVATSVAGYRIARDQPPTAGMSPFLGVRIFQSIPLILEGPSHVQKARIHFLAYSREELTAIRLADRMEHLLHARDEQADSPGGSGTNRGFFDFSSDDISCRQTRWRGRDDQDFDDDTDIWKVLVEADVIWLDEPCPSP